MKTLFCSLVIFGIQLVCTFVITIKTHLQSKKKVRGIDMQVKTIRVAINCEMPEQLFKLVSDGTLSLLDVIAISACGGKLELSEPLQHSAEERTNIYKRGETTNV